MIFSGPNQLLTAIDSTSFHLNDSSWRKAEIQAEVLPTFFLLAAALCCSARDVVDGLKYVLTS